MWAAESEASTPPGSVGHAHDLREAPIGRVSSRADAPFPMTAADCSAGVAEELGEPAQLQRVAEDEVGPDQPVSGEAIPPTWFMFRGEKTAGRVGCRHVLNFQSVDVVNALGD